MERTDRAVIPVACDWDDIGYWVALERLLSKEGNTVLLLAMDRVADLKRLLADERLTNGG